MFQIILNFNTGSLCPALDIDAQNQKSSRIIFVIIMSTDSTVTFKRIEIPIYTWIYIEKKVG